tara:strand:+ start:17818 stop:19704 length:1887 start_codon:yes stop_codon:yes gene_type:complete
MPFLLALFLFTATFSTPPSDTTTVISSIEKVTVFRNQAQIERTATFNLKTGKNVIVFTDLAQSLEENSIQIKAKGTFTLLSLTTKFNFTETKNSNTNIVALEKQKAVLEAQADEKRTTLTVNEGEIGFLKASQNILNNNKLTGAELNDLMATYRSNLSRLEKEKLNARRSLREIETQIQTINNQIREAGGVKRESFREVVAEIESETAQKLEFHLQYLVRNAGWRPTYDIRSENIEEPLSINFKAKIYQNTGYDWENVQFIVNSGDPSQNIERPILNPLYASFFSYNYGRTKQTRQKSQASINRTGSRGVVTGTVVSLRDGESLAGATIILKEINLGASADRNGQFTISGVPNGSYNVSVQFIGFATYSGTVVISNSGLDMRISLAEELVSMEELVISAAPGSSDKIRARTEKPRASAPVFTQQISNQTSFSYAIERPYSVPSDGKEYTLELKRETPNTGYKYSTTPKLSSFAYLVGEITNWDDLNLIEGDANVYFDNSFVGTNYLNPVALQDTLGILLGKDERINIERKKLKDFEERRFFGSKTRESLSYEITIRNTKPEAISISVEDQIPVSTDESIKVTPKDISGGKLDKETGIITWDLELKSNETKKLRIDFEVEYPKSKKIIY